MRLHERQGTGVKVIMKLSLTFVAVVLSVWSVSAQIPGPAVSQPGTQPTGAATPQTITLSGCVGNVNQSPDEFILSNAAIVPGLPQPGAPATVPPATPQPATPPTAMPPATPPAATPATPPPAPPTTATTTPATAAPAATSVNTAAGA